MRLFPLFDPELCAQRFVWLFKEKILRAKLFRNRVWEIIIFSFYWLSFRNRAKSPGSLQLLFKWKHWITPKSETKNHNNNVMHIVVAENNIFAVRLQKRARECSLRFISLHGNHITIDIEFFLLRFEIALGANCCIPSAWKQNIIIPVDKSSSRLHENVISTTKISFLKFEMIARECWRMI